MRLVSFVPFRIAPPDTGGKAVCFGAYTQYGRLAEDFEAIAVTTLHDRPPPPPTPITFITALWLCASINSNILVPSAKEFFV